LEVIPDKKMTNFKLFLSHRSSDKEVVQELLKSINTLFPNFPIINVADEVPYRNDWKMIATSTLESCDGLVCFVGEDTYKSEPINWEICEAHRLGKPLLVTTLSDQHKLPPACSDLQIQGVTWNVTKVADRIKEMLIPRILFFKHDWSVGAPESPMIFNQYNIMVQSWESLIERRQSVNTIYLSAVSALLAGIGVLISSIDKMGNIWAPIGIAFLAFLGAALSINWRQTILSYGTLSRAKAKVVTVLEAYLPAQLFDTEWQILEAKRYKSTTETDSHTAQFFCILFVVILFAVAGIALFQLI
jgi:hypothetical protein